MAARGKVLVVDDNGLVLKIVRGRLERAGFDVVTRSEALGTSRAVVDESPDVVLLDLRMPALTGDLIAELLHKHPRSRDTAVIFHSSEELTALQEKARQAGAVGAIAKTEDDALFLAQFERLFERAKRKKSP